jgi:hypothetical protein
LPVAPWTLGLIFGLPVSVLGPSGLGPLLVQVKSGFTAMLGRHGRGVPLVMAGYALLFMYFQQTLLIDGLSYTPVGPFSEHLLPGQWIVVSTTPPIPNMPFPLWGSPFISVTTNYFDLALTPLSIGITLTESFLVSTVIFFYYDVYVAAKQGFQVGRGLSVAQTLTLITVFLSCTCEFFEGVLAAVEPAAGVIVSSSLPSLLPVVDQGFLVFSLVILVTSNVYLSARTRGLDLASRVPREHVWFLLLGVPLTVFLLLGQKPLVGALSILVVTVSLVVHRLTHNRSVLAYTVPFLAYAAFTDMSPSAHGVAWLAFSVSMVLAVVVSVSTNPGRTGLAALIIAAALSLLINPLLLAVPVTMLGTSLLTRHRNAQLRDLLVYQALSWAPIMLGPIAVAYRPVPPIPPLGVQGQVEFYLYLWLIFTPVSWYLGIKAVFELLRRAGVGIVEPPTQTRRLGVDENIVLGVVGALAIVSQVAFYYAEPQVFLASSYQGQLRSLTVTTTSLILTLLGIGLLIVAITGAAKNTRTGLLGNLGLILRDKSKRRVYLATFIGYLVFSLISIGTFAWGGQAPPGLPTPSIGVFPSGPLLYAPSITLYLTKGLGVVLVPEHILVAVITSMLVALSYKAAALVSAARRGGRAGLIGGAPAVLLSCPTCTATSLYSLLGLNSALSGVGILVTPLLGTLVLAATWIGLVFTVIYASRKIGTYSKPPVKPYIEGAKKPRARTAK